MNNIQTVPFLGNPKDDLTGRTFSSLMVIGYMGPKMSSNGSRWLVQCICGNYETRRSQPLKRQRPEREYRCQICEQKAQRRRNSEFKALGYNRHKEINPYFDEYYNLETRACS